jgi:VCBS repeat-containing protein
VSTLEDVATSGTLTASDPDGDPLTYSIASQPSMGSAVITDVATGTFTYTPDPDKNGTDNFTFVASDGSSDSNNADVTITITADADAPVAQPGDLTTDEDTPANGTLTASDPDGDPLTYSIASPPSMGSAVITDMAAGTFTYTPDPDQNGTDSFTFSATDGSNFSNTETVSVTINPVNDPPVATGSCGNTLPNTLQSDPSDPALYSGRLVATDIDSAVLTYSLPNGPTPTSLTTAKGVVTIDSITGDFTYKPLNNADRGIDTFTYQVDDKDGEIVSATETIIVGKTIMPLGDSITAGTITPFLAPELRVAYRKSLYDALLASGITFDFVGAEDVGSAVPDFDFNNEGHGGWTALEIARGPMFDGTDGVFDWLDDNPADIILLHAGTNELSDTDEFDIAEILDEIDRWENPIDNPSGNPVTVILALIIDQDPFDGVVTDFNRKVNDMAEARRDDPNNAHYPDDIIIVDQQAALTYPADMSDTLHPNENGYAKIAKVWLDALTNVNPNTNEVVLDKCP